MFKIRVEESFHVMTMKICFLPESKQVCNHKIHQQYYQRWFAIALFRRLQKIISLISSLENGLEFKGDFDSRAKIFNVPPRKNRAWDTLILM